MKSLKLKLISGLLSSIMLVSMAGGLTSQVNAGTLDPMVTISDDINTIDLGKLHSFVTRLYKVCLGREPDKEGLNAWVARLQHREITGVATAYGFIFSKEFQSMECSNEEYIEYMYQAFFGRSADKEGLETWVNALNEGWSRQEVFAGFANSAEFADLCDKYGVTRGDYFVDFDWMQTNNVNLFVDRLYRSTLNRNSDVEGMTQWTRLLLTKEWSGAQVAYGFIFSKEFKDFSYCDKCYVNILYDAFMGRYADAAGFETWTDELYFGASRERVFNGFVGSNEFTAICESYGIERGAANAPTILDRSGMFRCSCGEIYLISNDFLAGYEVFFTSPSGRACDSSCDVTSIQTDIRSTISNMEEVSTFDTTKINKMLFGKAFYDEAHKSSFQILTLQMDSEKSATDFIALAKSNIGIYPEMFSGFEQFVNFGFTDTPTEFSFAIKPKTNGNTMFLQIKSTGSVVRYVLLVNNEGDPTMNLDMVNYYRLLQEQTLFDTVE